MCCKEGLRSTKHAKDLKTKALWKTYKAKKKAFLRQRRKGGRRRVLRNSRQKMAIKGTSTTGEKCFAVNSNSRENFSEFGLSRRLNSVEGVSCFTTPVKNRAPVEDLAMETDFESLPVDILVRIVCNVHHDELKPLFHVSSKFREAVQIARQMHFDYTTPVRVRATKKRANSPTFDESLECFLSPSERPVTPDAPKQVGKSHKLRISFQEIKEISTLLLSPGISVKENDATCQNHFLRSGGATNRVLFVEEDLCEAVARNRL